MIGINNMDNQGIMAAAVENMFSPSAWPGRVLPAEHPLAPAATVEAETQPATRTCFPTTEAGTGRLHLRRPPKIANATRMQILGPKVPSSLG